MSLDEVVFNALKPLGSTKKFLLALSGGLDSCVLFYLLKKSELNFRAAHANYGLRGEESDLDEAFVEQLCAKNGIHLYKTSLNTNEFKAKNNASTQSAARELRYDWFKTLQEDWEYDFLITGHHLNDSVETFFINLLRGTGIKGLTGIKDSSENLRPLLGFSKEEIRNFAMEYNISWREDSSNSTDDYVRNQIRHHIIPEFEKVNPAFLNNFRKTIHYLQGDVQLIQSYIDNFKKDNFRVENGIIHIPVEKLVASNDSMLFHLFEPFGFHSPTEIRKLMTSSESAEMQSENFRLIKNRNELLLLPNIQNKKDLYLISELSETENPVRLKFTVSHQKPSDNSHNFDFNRIKFPLSLRLRQNGDVFFPEGMNGQSKKVSKFFKDLKLSKIDKENTWLLCDALDRIIWIVGYRRDERFIATKETTTWLQIEKLD